MYSPLQCVFSHNNMTWRSFCQHIILMIIQNLKIDARNHLAILPFDKYDFNFIFFAIINNVVMNIVVQIYILFSDKSPRS